jgi:hypothetical protein
MEHFFGPPMEKLLKLVGEILVEVKALRKDYADGQAVMITEVGAPEPIDFDKLLQDTFHTSYER